MEQQEYTLIDQVEDHMWWFHAMHENLLRLLDQFLVNRSGVILDGGCGTGRLMYRLKNAFQDATVIGIDIELRAAARAEEKSGARAVIGSVNQLPFANESFSAMTSGDIFCQRGVDPELASREAFRCLEPGGVLIVEVPAYDWMCSAHDDRVQSSRRYTAKTLSQTLTMAGFKIVYISYWNALLFPLMVLRRKVFTPKNLESDLKLLPKSVEVMFRAVMRLEYIFLKAGFRLPFGGEVMAVGLKNTAVGQRVRPNSPIA